jgi:hypothetical protein
MIVEIIYGLREVALRQHMRQLHCRAVEIVTHPLQHGDGFNLTQRSPVFRRQLFPAIFDVIQLTKHRQQHTGLLRMTGPTFMDLATRVCCTRSARDARVTAKVNLLKTAPWKQHIRCRQNQQVRGHQGGGAEALT